MQANRARALVCARLLCPLLLGTSLGFACSAEPEQRTNRRVASEDAIAQPTPPSHDTSADAVELRSIINAECPEKTEPDETYGQRSFTVDSRTYWQNSGLYLQAGQTATVAASGEWTIWNGETAPFGPDGHEQLSIYEGCRKGSLVARVGLGLGSQSLHCVGSSGTIMAEADGIVYFAMNDSATPELHNGKLTVTIDSDDGILAPDVSATKAATFDYCAYGSGWVELRSAKRFILTIPTALANKERATLVQTLDDLDRLYDRYSELAGTATPYGGMRIRLYPDFAVRSTGWMLTGNPLLYDPRNLAAVEPSPMRLLSAFQSESNAFDLARAIGVAFSRAHGSRYQPDDAAAQAWGGLFATYAKDVATGAVNTGTPSENPCKSQAAYEQSGDFAQLAKSSDLQLCLLTALEAAGGWEAFQKYFAGLPVETAAWDQALPQGTSIDGVWSWIAGTYLTANGDAAKTIFERFHVTLK